jgi:hypothetical protein
MTVIKHKTLYLGAHLQLSATCFGPFLTNISSRTGYTDAVFNVTFTDTQFGT